MPAWLSAIAALRARGLEPLPQPKFFAELGGLMKYVCGLITQDRDALSRCEASLPTTLPPPASVLSSQLPVRVGTVVRPIRVGISTTAPSRGPTFPAAKPPTPYAPQKSAALSTLQEIDARIKKADDIIPVMAAQLANPSSQTFGAGTVRDAGTQIVNALRSINALVKQASDINRVQTLQQEYQMVQEMIGDRITAIQGLVTAATSPTADKVTATNAAKAIIDQIKGIQGLQGAEELVQRALVLNRRAAGGG
jgi:hypothetical protein